MSAAFLARPEQLNMTMKLLIVENENMRLDACELRLNLEQSRAQIQELRANLAQAEELGMRDSLTNLRSGRCFDPQSVAANHRGSLARTQLSLIMGDIDHFKHVNGTLAVTRC
jgi:diguanylate cyclase